jgi:hypothetical protein
MTLGSASTGDFLPIRVLCQQALRASVLLEALTQHLIAVLWEDL